MCASLSPQGRESAWKWRSTQACTRPPPGLTRPQEPLTAAPHVLSEDPSSATLWVAGAATITNAAAKAKAHERCLIGAPLTSRWNSGLASPPALIELRVIL